MGGGLSKQREVEQAIRVGLEKQQAQIDALKVNLEIKEKLAAEIQGVVTERSAAHKEVVDQQKLVLEEQNQQITALRAECARLRRAGLDCSAVVHGQSDSQAVLLQKERYNLEMHTQMVDQEDRVLEVHFECVQCRRTLALREVKNFCDCDGRLRRLKGMQEEEHEMFLELRPYFRQLFDLVDKNNNNYLEGVELCRIVAAMELADVPAQEKAAKRRANMVRKYGNRDKRFALLEFNAAREYLTFEEFWARLNDVNKRPPMYVFHFLFEEYHIFTPIGETFPHVPGERMVRKLLKIPDPPDYIPSSESLSTATASSITAIILSEPATDPEPR